MKDEIKEILDNLKFNVYETGNWEEPLGLSQDIWKHLLDYITNLQEENERYKNIIDELKWKPIEEYEKPKYDWVLVKYFIEPNFECIPCVAENRFGKWYDRNDNLINGEVRYFADMQLLDTLEELKGE